MKQDKRLLLIVKKFASVFNSIASVLGIILMGLMIFTLSAGIISRYIFNNRKNSPITHIGVDFLGSFLSSELRKIVKRIVWSLIILFCIVITVIDINFIALAGSIKTAALGIPKFIIYITLLIFAIITLVFSLEQWLAQGNNEGKP